MKSVGQQEAADVFAGVAGEFDDLDLPEAGVPRGSHDLGKARSCGVGPLLGAAVCLRCCTQFVHCLVLRHWHMFAQGHVATPIGLSMVPL